MGNNMRRLRAARGLTQGQLADLAGTTARRVSYWECGNNIWLADAVCVADALGCTLDELAGRSSSPQRADTLDTAFLSDLGKLDGEGRRLVRIFAEALAKAGGYAAEDKHGGE